MTLVLLDSNEQSTNPTVAHELADVFGAENVMVTHLSFGDVNIPLATGLLAVERKTPDDLMASIADGRVFEQAYAMVTGAKFPAFIVHGEFHYNREGFVTVGHNHRVTGWRARSVRAALLSIQWSGCAIVQVPEADYATTVLEMVGLADKPEHIQRGREHPVTFPPIDPRIDFLCGVPGIGPQRAEALLNYTHLVSDEPGQDELGSLADALAFGSMMTLTPKADRPDGWGDVTIRKFREFLGLAADDYIMRTKQGGGTK